MMMGVLVSMVWGGAVQAATLDRVAAVVNEDVVALSEVYDLGSNFIAQRCPVLGDVRCVGEAEREVLEALFERSLIRQELVRLGVDVTSQDVDRAMDGMLSQYKLPDGDALRTEVEKQGIPWETYREQLTEQLRQMKFTENVIRPSLTVSENELLDLYQRSVRDFGTGVEAQLEAFALKVPEGTDPNVIVQRAQVLADAVNRGEQDWKQTVKEKDEGPYAARDGVMGTFKKGELNPALDSVVFQTEEGKVARPLNVGGAVLVIRVAKLESSGVLPLDQVRPQLRERLYTEKAELAVEAWTVEARRKAAIRITLDALAPSAVPTP